MFDLHSYTILLNEAFDTGHDNDDLYGLLEAFLAAENEAVRRINTDSSELHRIMNNNRIMHAFTRVMGGRVRLNTCFRQRVTQLGALTSFCLKRLRAWFLVSGLMAWWPAPSVLKGRVLQSHPCRGSSTDVEYV